MPCYWNYALVNTYWNILSYHLRQMNNRQEAQFPAYMKRAQQLWRWTCSRYVILFLPPNVVYCSIPLWQYYSYACEPMALSCGNRSRVRERLAGDDSIKDNKQFGNIQLLLITSCINSYTDRPNHSIRQVFARIVL